MGRSGDPDYGDGGERSSDGEENELDELEVSGGSRQHIHPASALLQR